MAQLRGVIPTLILVSLLGCSPSGGAADEAVVAEVRQAIERTNAELQEAFRQGDPDAAARLFTEDGSYMPNGSPTVIGRDYVGRFLAPIFRRWAVATFELTPTELEVYGETAYEFGTFDWMAVRRTSSDTMIDQGRYAAVRRRSADGTWLIHRLLENTKPREHPQTEMP